MLTLWTTKSRTQYHSFKATIHGSVFSQEKESEEHFIKELSSLKYEYL